jgi:hypothetical protein
MEDLSPAELSTLCATLGQQVKEAAARLQIERPEFILVLVREDDSRVAATCPKYLASTILHQAARKLEISGARELEQIKSGVE